MKTRSPAIKISQNQTSLPDKILSDVAPLLQDNDEEIQSSAFDISQRQSSLLETMLKKDIYPLMDSDEKTRSAAKTDVVQPL